MILSVCPATSNLTLLGGDAILLPLYNPVPGTGHSQLRVLGSVNVASTVGLYVFENTPGALSASITAIDNDATDAVSGTFQNLPEGATFAVSDLRAARITYIGGTGNDVVVSPTNAPPTRLVSILKTNGNMQLQATGGIENLQYTLQMATNLSVPVQWSNVTAAYPVYPTDRLVFTDPSPASAPRRFYRVASP